MAQQVPESILKASAAKVDALGGVWLRVLEHLAEAELPSRAYLPASPELRLEYEAESPDLACAVAPLALPKVLVKTLGSSNHRRQDHRRRDSKNHRDHAKESVLQTQRSARDFRPP
jgi:hypothetical protein